jgi:hypothetical protein
MLHFVFVDGLRNKGRVLNLRLLFILIMNINWLPQILVWMFRSILFTVFKVNIPLSYTEINKMHNHCAVTRSYNYNVYRNTEARSRVIVAVQKE